MSDPATIAAHLRRLRDDVMSGTQLADDEDAERRLREARAKRRALGGLQLNLTPMIDVTFLLLVFFVCTTKALDKEGLLRADLSERGGAMPADALSLDEPPLRVELRREDARTRVQVLAPMPQPEDPEELGFLLASRRYGPENPAGIFAADHPIELAPSADAPWEDTVAAFNAITRAGYTRVSFARPQ
ncbi:MAG: biopolymer transporter ExbD [Planctomycetes bacterium]|nr:biopolymer transporter ExbD [Planctomycetota bacterium]